MTKMNNFNAKTGLLILAAGLSIGLSSCNKADNEPKEQQTENTVTTVVDDKIVEQDAAEDMQATPFVPEGNEAENIQETADEESANDTKSQAELEAEALALAAADDVTE